MTAISLVAWWSNFQRCNNKMSISMEWDSDGVTIHANGKRLELHNGQAQTLKSWLCNMPDDRFNSSSESIKEENL